MRDVLGLTLDKVYRWMLLLEEYRPKIAYIKGIHNTVADTISQFEYDHSVNQTAESYYMTKFKSSKHSQRQNWMIVSRHWCNLAVNTDTHEDLNHMFAHHEEEEEIYPLCRSPNSREWTDHSQI